MDFVIFKHELDDRKWKIELELHKGAKILSVQVQKTFNTEKLILWEAHKDNEPEMEKREFILALTGSTYPVFKDQVTEYIATLQTSWGIVYHVFEVKTAAVVSESRLVSVKKVDKAPDWVRELVDRGE
jgi:hypothetical protein